VVNGNGTQENAYLILGCHGREEDGFILCPSTENRILKLDESLVDFGGVVEYLEAVQLFDRPMLDYNALRHLIHNLQDRFDQKVRRLWTEHKYNLIERFMVMHRPCGLYAKLVLLAEEKTNGKSKENEYVFIKGTPEPMVKQSFANENAMVRGRR
jgi:hypothetical protein